MSAKGMLAGFSTVAETGFVPIFPPVFRAVPPRQSFASNFKLGPGSSEVPDFHFDLRSDRHVNLLAKVDGYNAASTFFGRSLRQFNAAGASESPKDAFINMVVQQPVPKSTTPQPRLRSFRTEDIEVFQMKKTLGTGGFGCVFKGCILTGEDAGTEVVVKALNNEQRTWMQGDVEVYVNEKLMADNSELIAQFIGHHKSYGKYWLIWKLEGEYTLDHYFADSDWLRKIEARLIGRGANDGLSDSKRKSIVCKEIMRQVIQGLRLIHRHHVVHRDIKPSNVVIGNDGTLKIIDFGCAVDLDSKIGYIPKEAPGTREYLPPEWRVDLDAPAAFDMFAAGMIMLQIAFPHLRSTDALDKFRSEMRSADEDVDKWLQRKMRGSHVDGKLVEGLAVLNEDNGAGWQFLKALLQAKPTKRINAGEALVHSFLRAPDTVPDNILEKLSPELLRTIVREDVQKQPVYTPQHRPTIYSNGIEVPIEPFPHRVDHVEQWPREFPRRSRPGLFRSPVAPGVGRRPRLGEQPPQVPRRSRSAGDVRRPDVGSRKTQVAARRNAQAIWNERTPMMRPPRSFAAAAAAQRENEMNRRPGAGADAWWRSRDHPAEGSS